MKIEKKFSILFTCDASFLWFFKTISSSEAIQFTQFPKGVDLLLNVQENLSNFMFFLPFSPHPHLYFLIVIMLWHQYGEYSHKFIKIVSGGSFDCGNLIIQSEMWCKNGKIEIIGKFDRFCLICWQFYVCSGSVFKAYY